MFDKKLFYSSVRVVVVVCKTNVSIRGQVQAIKAWSAENREKGVLVGEVEGL